MKFRCRSCHNMDTRTTTYRTGVLYCTIEVFCPECGARTEVEVAYCSEGISHD